MTHRYRGRFPTPLPLQTQPPPLIPLENINPQLASPLFNGFIPRELTDAIFSFVITEDNAALSADDQRVLSGSAETSPAVTDRCREIVYPVNTHYTRPDYTHKKVLSLSILRTCKLAYLNLRHLPPVCKEHVFWHERRPKGNQRFFEEWAYLNRFQPDSLARITSLHLFTQQYWLENSFQHTISTAPVQGVQRLVITLRRGDWWNWEENAALGLDAPAGNGNVESMKLGFEKMGRGEEITWRRLGWAGSLQTMGALRELVLELETAAYKKAELKEIVDHAVLWRIPMGERGVLISRKSTVKVEEWRGPPCLWADRCGVCGLPDTAPKCEACEEKNGLLKEEKGPMVIMMKLKFELESSGGGVVEMDGVNGKGRIES